LLKAGIQSGNFSCLMAPAGPWELAFFCFGVGTYFSRVSAKFFWGFFFLSFLVVFLRFLVVISHFWG